MTISKIVPSTVRRILGTVVLVIGFASASNAQLYSFDKFISGGRLGAAQTSSFVCLSVTPGAQANTVSLTIGSRSPQRKSRINAIAFDMGRHAGLFRSVAVLVASSGVKAKVVPARTHPFLSGLTPEFWIDIPHRGHLNPEGLSPGRLITISAALGGGKTIADVVNALNEGLNPTSGADGLRIGLIIQYMAGGPPPGVGSIHDDGGFVTSAPSSACR